MDNNDKLLIMKSVAIGSKNPAKIRAVSAAFQKVLPGETLDFIPIEVESGIADQPMSDNESILGAQSRAQAAMKLANADFGVGLEGGLHELGSTWFTGNIACVVTRDAKYGYGLSPKVTVPLPVVEAVKAGKNLSDAMHDVFGIKDIGKKDGLLGYMTDGHITRASASEQAVISALCSTLKA